MFELAALIRRVDRNPRHGAALVRKALLLLARSMADGDDAAHDLPRDALEIDLPAAFTLLDRLAAGGPEMPDTATPDERARYDALLDAAPRLCLQARDVSGERVPWLDPRALRRALAGLGALLAIIALAASAFRLQQEPVALPAPSATPPEPDVTEPEVVRLPATVHLDAEGAARGPVGREIRFTGQTGQYRVIVEARATFCAVPGAPASDAGSKYPAVEFQIDGTRHHHWYVDSESIKRYESTPFTLTPGVHSGRFFFINDFFLEGTCDRNVWIERVQFDGSASP